MTKDTGSNYTQIYEDNPLNSSTGEQIYQHITGLEPATMYTFRLSAQLSQNEDYSTDYVYLNATTTCK